MTPETLLYNLALAKFTKEAMDPGHMLAHILPALIGAHVGHTKGGPKGAVAGGLGGLLGGDLAIHVLGPSILPALKTTASGALAGGVIGAGAGAGSHLVARRAFDKIRNHPLAGMIPEAELDRLTGGEHGTTKGRALAGARIGALAGLGMGGGTALSALIPKTILHLLPHAGHALAGAYLGHNVGRELSSKDNRDENAHKGTMAGAGLGVLKSVLSS